MILRRGSAFVFSGDRFPFVLKVVDFGEVDGKPGILAQNYGGGDVVFIGDDGIDSIRILNIYESDRRELGFDLNGEREGKGR